VLSLWILLFICLEVVILTFALAGGCSGWAENSARGGDRADEQVTLLGLPPCETLCFRLKLLILVRLACWILRWCQDRLGSSTAMLPVDRMFAGSKLYCIRVASLGRLLLGF
jgi:hypothetical protein